MSEITKEQLAVIEAAKAWLRSRYAVTKTVELVDAIDALVGYVAAADVVAGTADLEEEFNA